MSRRSIRCFWPTMTRPISCCRGRTQVECSNTVSRAARMAGFMSTGAGRAGSGTTAGAAADVGWYLASRVVSPGVGAVRLSMTILFDKIQHANGLWTTQWPCPFAGDRPSVTAAADFSNGCRRLEGLLAVANGRQGVGASGGRSVPRIGGWERGPGRVCWREPGVATTVGAGWKGRSGRVDGVLGGGDRVNCGRFPGKFCGNALFSTETAANLSSRRPFLIYRRSECSILAWPELP